MDKGLKSFQNGRRIAVLMVACLMILALPTMAFAASFTGEYPATTIHSQPGVVGVTVTGSTLNAAKSLITINGVKQATFTDQGSLAGVWTPVYTGPDANGAYTVHWLSLIHI